MKMKRKCNEIRLDPALAEVSDGVFFPSIVATCSKWLARFHFQVYFREDPGENVTQGLR